MCGWVRGLLLPCFQGLLRLLLSEACPAQDPLQWAHCPHPLCLPQDPPYSLANTEKISFAILIPTLLLQDKPPQGRGLRPSGPPGPPRPRVSICEMSSCTKQPAQCSDLHSGAPRGPGDRRWGPRSLSSCLNHERKLQDGHLCTQVELCLSSFPARGLRPEFSHTPCHALWGPVARKGGRDSVPSF